jgi:hypothetical protein
MVRGIDNGRGRKRKCDGGGERKPGDGSDSQDLEPYHRLIELQKQMVELAEAKIETERDCVVLRERLSREAEALYRSRRGIRFRLRKAGSKVLKRLRNLARLTAARRKTLPRKVRSAKRLTRSLPPTAERRPAVWLDNLNHLERPAGG